MKQHYTLFSILFSLFTIITPSVFGQQKPCNNYACVIEKIERLMKQPQKDYKAILDNLDSAEGYPNSNPEQIRKLRRRVFGAIEGEKKKAKEAEEKAVKLAENLQIEKEKANLAFLQADSARKKAQAVLDKIYFYEDKFGLAYDTSAYYGFGGYGFIDRDLKTKIDFKYREALPFDYTGFAKVKRQEIYYLIDTFGIEYKLTTDITQLDSSITALDLSNKKLKEIPPSIFQQTQLKVLVLSQNQLTSLPSDFGKLTNLVRLDLSQNQLNSLPSDFGKLTNLIRLDLSENKLDSLPTGFGNLTYLTKLNLSHNKLKSLPPEFGNFTNLMRLDLNNNQLIRLPAQIEKLIKLKTLVLHNNQLNSLPLGLKKLPNLEYLDLWLNLFLKEEQGLIKKFLPNCYIKFEY